MKIKQHPYVLDKVSQFFPIHWYAIYPFDLDESAVKVHFVPKCFVVFLYQLS